MNSFSQVDKRATDGATPILDSGLLPPRRRGGMAKVLATGLIVGVVLMEGLALLGGMWREHWPAILMLLFILAITIHELGHLIAGWAVGFQFSSIQVGPLALENQYGILRARISLDMIALGYARMYADNARKLRRRLLIYCAGGPAANLSTAVIIILASHLVPSSPMSAFATAMGQFAAISLLLAMISLAPLTANDGDLLQMLFVSPLEARRFISTVALGAQFKQGVRPRNWKQTWVKAATSIPDRSGSEFYAVWMAYLSANDRKDADLASEHLERCLELTQALPTSLRDLVAQEAAVFSAWFRNDGGIAEKWLLQLKKRHSLLPVLQARIEVALNCANGDFDGSIAAWERGFRQLEQMPMQPPTRSLKESWLEWRAEIEQRQGSAVAQ
jgi:hypothetical protein